MEEAGVRRLRFLALQLVGAVAVIHLVVGGEQAAAIVAQGLLVEYLTAQVFQFPRAFLFVASAVATFVGVLAVARGRLDYRRAYLLGVGLMVTYLGGWVAWHTVLDHGVALGGGVETTTHTHGGLVDTLGSHYVEPLVATLARSTTGQPGTGRTLLGIVSKTLELAALAVLATLLRVDPRARADGEDDPTAVPE